MKKKIGYILIVLLCSILFLLLGIGIGKRNNSSDKCEKEIIKEEGKEENVSSEDLFIGNFDEKFKVSEIYSTNDYFVIAGYRQNSSNEEIQSIYVFDMFGKLIKNIDNAHYIDKVNIGNDIGYQIDIELGRGGEHSTTYILNEEFEIILESSKLPEEFEGMDNGLFTPRYNSDGTISVMINDIYVYDYDGNLIKTIKNENEFIKGITKDYYLINENGKISLVKIADGSKLLVLNKKNANIAYLPISGAAPLIYWDEDELVVYIVEDEENNRDIASIYKFKEKNGKLVQISKETDVEVGDWY
ncbi:MAG: hypothetical protein ACI4XM_07880 [Candidatus Coprovivens sp.]